MGGRVGEHTLFPVEVPILVRVADRHRVDLGELVAQEIDFTGPRPLVPTEFGECPFGHPEFIEQRCQRLWIDPAELVECCPLHRRLEQGLMGVLSVEIDEIDPEPGERGDGGEISVDVDPTPAFTRNHSTNHDLVFTDDEAALDLGLVGAGTNQ